MVCSRVCTSWKLRLCCIFTPSRKEGKPNQEQISGVVRATGLRATVIPHFHVFVQEVPNQYFFYLQAGFYPFIQRGTLIETAQNFTHAVIHYLM